MLMRRRFQFEAVEPRANQNTRALKVPNLTSLHRLLLKLCFFEVSCLPICVFRYRDRRDSTFSLVDVPPFFGVPTCMCHLF